jgi:hypothetical protein
MRRARSGNPRVRVRICLFRFLHHVFNVGPNPSDVYVSVMRCWIGVTKACEFDVSDEVVIKKG